jgi:proteasome accessory factor B
MNINKPQYARLLFIDEKVRSGSYPNAATIAEEYEVAQRTILRDIEYMRDMLGAPIEYDNSRRGYFYLEKNFFLPALDMSESDFFAICITEQALKQYENTPLYEKLSVIFKRLREYLPESIRVNTTWIDTEYTFMHESFTRIDPDVWENVSSALRWRKQIDILHRKAGAPEDVRRVVDPYHIVNYRGEWYLVGFCHKRKSVVRFAMSRISSALIQDKGYIIPDNFNFS